jgi:hypothetical protein
MQRIAIVVAILAACSMSAGAESSLVDFSKPMSGKSRFAVNSDGSPLELGPSKQAAPAAAPAAGKGDRPKLLKGGVAGKGAAGRKWWRSHRVLLRQRLPRHQPRYRQI